ncbi:hypothetical protein RDWZM_007916, partial [Blomia tropicalis]
THPYGMRSTGIDQENNAITTTTKKDKIPTYKLIKHKGLTMDGWMDGWLVCTNRLANL